MTTTAAHAPATPTATRPDSIPVSAAPADRFDRPALAWYLINDSGLASLVTLSLSSAAYDAVAARVPVPSRRIIRRITIGLGVLHVFEAGYAFRSARAAGLSRSARTWGLQTFIVGFPALGKLRSLIRSAR